MVDLYTDGEIISNIDDLEFDLKHDMFFGHAIMASKRGIWGDACPDDGWNATFSAIVPWEIVAANLKKYRPDLME